LSTDMKRIHIVGSGPRTGTTLMAEAMVACFRIDHHADHEARIFSPPPAEGDVYLTKAPQDLLVVRPLLRVNPSLHVICLIRDPRDAIVSEHGNVPGQYYAGLRYWKAYLPYWRRARDHPRFVTVKYEDFVTHPDIVQGRLMEAMPFLEMEAPFSRYHEVARPSDASVDALRGVRPIAPTSVGKWRNHLPRVAGQLQLHGSISEDLIELGYERDYAWLELLEGVEPDTSPSHWPEHFTEEELRDRRRQVWKEILKIGLRRLGIDPAAIRDRLPF
jgi:hypothetical protein